MSGCWHGGVECAPARPAGLLAFAKVRFGSTAEVRRFARALASAFRSSRADLADAIERYAAEHPSRFMRGDLNEGDIVALLERPLLDAYTAGARRVMEDAARGEFLSMGLGSKAFRPGTPHATAWLDGRGAEMVTSITDQTRKGVRVLVARMIREGGADGGDIAAVRSKIGDLVGLTPRDVRAVVSREKALRAAGGYTEGRVRAEVARYSDRLLDRRAMSIARTESNRASNAGVQVAWKDAQDQGLLPTNVEKVWVAATGYACPACEELDGQAIPTHESWSHPAVGRVSSPPAHPQCRCAMGLRGTDR